MAGTTISNSTTVGVTLTTAAQIPVTVTSSGKVSVSGTYASAIYVNGGIVGTITNKRDLDRAERLARASGCTGAAASPMAATPTRPR